MSGEDYSPLLGCRCGARAESVRVPWREWASWHVECRVCGAKGPSSVSEKRAIYLWYYRNKDFSNAGN